MGILTRRVALCLCRRDETIINGQKDGKGAKDTDAPAEQ